MHHTYHIVFNVNSPHRLGIDLTKKMKNVNFSSTFNTVFSPVTVNSVTDFP